MQHNDETTLLQFAYNTNVLKGQLQKVQNITNQIESLLLVSSDDYLFKKIGAHIIGVVGSTDHIPIFYHPIIYKNKAYIDIRAYISRDGGIRSLYEYGLLVRRAHLDLAWAENKELFYSQEAFIIDVFSSWFSFGLQKNHADVSLLTATNYRVAAAIYYLGLFSNEHIHKDDDIVTELLKRIPRITRIPLQTINELIESNASSIISLYRNGIAADPINRISQLCEILTLLTNEDLTITPGIIYNSLCRGAFIAGNAVEITSVAIEHPPTFIAMVSVVFQGSQNNTTLGRALLGVGRRYNTNFDKFIIDITQG